MMKNIKESVRILLTPKLVYQLMKYYYYFSSIEEINNSLHGRLKLLIFPFLGKGDFNTSSGKEIQVPRKYWYTLPTIAKIVSYGACPRWGNDILYIKYNKITLATSPLDKSSTVSIKEMFIGDEYKLDEINVKGKSILDIGANIGDSSLAFALASAKVVHAFEPLPMLQKFIKKNISLNGYNSVIKLYPVGLSDKNENVEIWGRNFGTAGSSAVLHKVGKVAYQYGFIKQNLVLVDAISYLKEKKISKIDVIKMDCEHCEYVLLKDDILLKYLDPSIILIEFHAGEKKLVPILKKCGYHFTITHKSEFVGLIFAEK